jgi:dGTPase
MVGGRWRRTEIEVDESGRLAPWGARATASLGRVHPEPEHAYRTCFARDRDRILHSTAFRRLQYKTQVFVQYEGDHFRNRLTHTLEVAQIARTVARALRVNEDLTEAIVLAHDLGHTPFGHAGQRAMHELLEPHGGFEHNRQSLRIVDWLEVRNARYRGLNLTMETRAGLLKHGASHPAHSHPVPLPDLERARSVEAQIANLADSIAYGAHDIDDGLRSGLIDDSHLADLPLWRAAVADSGGKVSGDPRTRRSVISAVIHRLASDVIETSWDTLAARDAAAGEIPQDVVRLSDEGEVQRRELGRRLMRDLYSHPDVVRMGAHGGRILQDLFASYIEDPSLLPPHVRERTQGEHAEERIRVTADYLAGMTDRFAMDEHEKLFGPAPRADV